MEYTVHSLQSQNLKDLYTQTYTIHFSIKNVFFLLFFFCFLFVLTFDQICALLKSNYLEGSDYKSSKWSNFKTHSQPVLMHYLLIKKDLSLYIFINKYISITFFNRC